MALTEIMHLRSDVRRLQNYLGFVVFVVFWTLIYWAVQKFFGWPN